MEISGGGGSNLVITELDGSPSGVVTLLKVTNGSLTDNGGGSFTLAVGGTATVNVGTPTGTIDGNNVTFTVTNSPIFLVLNGLIQTVTVDYSIAALTITMVNAPPTGSVFRYYY